MTVRKRVSIAVLLLVLVAAPGFAPCWYPEQTTVEYWQYHASCTTGSFPQCSEWWSLDGECTTDCAGVQACSGDTEIRERTYTVTRVERCPDLVCD